MRCTLESVGVPLGSVVLTPGERIIVPLEPLRAYEGSQTREVARSVGIALRAIGWSSRLGPHVHARALASALSRAHAQQCTLTLTDERGGLFPVVRILVIEFPRDPLPAVVASIRDEPAGRVACVIPPSRNARGAR